MKKRTKYLAGTAALAALLTLSPAVTTPTAQAAEQCARSHLEPSPADKGGEDAVAWWYSGEGCDGSLDFGVSFDASDEVLNLTTNTKTDYLYADVEVYRPGGTVPIDTDKILGKGRHEIGTPDGSGNLTEGLIVNVRVCGEYDGKKKCSYWATGKA